MSWRQHAAHLRGKIDGLERAASITNDILAGTVWAGSVRQKLKEAMAEVTAELAVPSSGSDTSAKAARNLQPRADSLRWKALEAYANAPGGLTDEEVGEKIGHPRIWPRCSELRTVGLITETDETRMCKRTGQETRVCEITDSGLAVLG